MVLRGLLTVVAGLGYASSNNPKSNWEGLRDGLTAWETFGFDTNFTFDVIGKIKGEEKLLFHYPGKSPDLESFWARETQIRIRGAKSGRLHQVTAPAVRAIMQNKDPIGTSGPGSVSRHDFLARGGGLTLPALVEVAGGEMQNGDKWQPLRDGIDTWAKLAWDVNFTFNVGDSSGPLFTYTKGSTGMHTRLPGASLSKWPAALTVAGLVAEGKMSFDDKPSKYLKWWTTDRADLRSQVTLRDLLTFQSGYTSDAEVACAINPNADFLECAKELYEKSNSTYFTARPGTTFAYISTHLQFAGAMAVAASGLRPDKLFQKYLYEPNNMTETTWSPPKNPPFAVGITTTGSDFEKMLRNLLTYDFLGERVLDETEKDWSAPPVSPCGDGWFGHYSMGHWFDCMGYAAGHKEGAAAALSMQCLQEAIPAGPGAFGYFPLLDRKRKYYMQIVLAEDSNCRSEVPEYLRILAKPIVDSIITGESSSERALLEREGGLLLREILDIYNYLPPRCTPSAVAAANNDVTIVV